MERAYAVSDRVQPTLRETLSGLFLQLNLKAVGKGGMATYLWISHF